MKIMIATPYFYPKIGGLENYALNMAKELMNQGYDVFVVTTNHESKKYIEEEVEGLRVIRLPIAFKFSNTPLNFKWYFQLKKIIRREKPDIINAHSPVPGMADMAIRAAGSVKTILTYHAATLDKDGGLLFKVVARVYRLIQIPTFKKSTSIIAVSDYVKECLPKAFQQKTTVIYNAVNPAEVPSKEITRLANRLVFVGSLDSTHAWKGLSDILKAILIVKQTNKNIELVILGDGNMRSEYEDQVKSLNLQANVIFHGFVTGDSKYQIIRSSSALLTYPNTANDAFPTVFTEAWACGTPIIASRIGALSSLLEEKDRGILVEPSEPTLLAKAIRDLLKDKKTLTRMRKKGKILVTEKFNWRISCDEFIKLSQNLLRQKVCIIHNVIAPYRLPLFEELSKSLNLTVLFCKPITKDRIWSTDLNGYTFKSVILKSYSLGPIIFNRFVFRILRSEKFDVVITNSDPDTITATIASILYTKNYNKELIVWSEVIDTSVNFSPTIAYGKKKYQRLTRCILSSTVLTYRKICFHYANSFLAFSEKAKDLLINLGVQKSKIARTIQVMPISQLPNSTKEIARTGKTVLYIGYLLERKGINYLIDAFKEISDPKAKLIIAGSGPIEAKLRNQAADDKRIRFKGYVEGSAKADLYTAADIFVLPTLSDCWGLVVNEAIHYNLTVLCSTAAGAAELVNGKNLFDPTETHKLAELLDHTINRRNIPNQKMTASVRSVTDISSAAQGFYEAIAIGKI